MLLVLVVSMLTEMSRTPDSCCFSPSQNMFGDQIYLDYISLTHLTQKNHFFRISKFLGLCILCVEGKEISSKMKYGIEPVLFFDFFFFLCPIRFEF